MIIKKFEDLSIGDIFSYGHRIYKKIECFPYYKNHEIKLYNAQEETGDYQYFAGFTNVEYLPHYVT